MRKTASWIICISIVLIVAAGFLNQKALFWIKPFAGATLAIFAPISFGFLIGFLLGFDPSGRETTVLAKFVKIALALAAGASLASVGPVVEAARTYLPQIASDLKLNSGTLLFLFPTFSIPAFFIGYLWRANELKELADLIEALRKLRSPENVIKFILEKPKEYDELLDRYEDRKALISQRYGEGISGLVPAMNLYRRNEHEVVLKFLEKYKASEDERGQANLIIGASLMRLRRYDEALKHLIGIKDVEDFKPGVNKILAQCYWETGKVREAKKYCSEYLNAQSEDTEATKLQLKLLKKEYDLSGSEKEREPFLSEARDFARNVIEKGVLKNEEVNDIWPSLA